jgi:antitoxin component of MazEF toxin-antitoxin module
MGAPMLAKMTRRLYRDGESIRLGLPKIWVDALGLKGGDAVEIAFDELLVVVPRKSAQADRVLKAMLVTH